MSPTAPHRPRPRAAGEGPAPAVFTVSALNQVVRELLEEGLGTLWVEGEVSNLARPASGHIYFSLKDDRAQVRCALFRGQQRGLATLPVEGMHVLVRARVTLYPERGDYQLVVQHLEEAGEGALKRAFEALKARLAAEGLFDAAAKRPLPALPRRVGVITSASGAAIRDILTTLRRRCPAIPVRIYPVPVQGEGAAQAIAAALALAGRRRDCDVLILARGGGSLEDLWAFNEEVVARALRACPVPVVCGVGHEVDVTIADLAADRRAPTPTAAAELVSPDGEALRGAVSQLRGRLLRLMQDRLASSAQRADGLAARLVHPAARIRHHRQRLADLAVRLAGTPRVFLAPRRAALERQWLRLQRASPRQRLRLGSERLAAARERLRLLVAARLERARDRLAAAGAHLEAVSPLAILGRGYSLLRREADGRLVTRHDQVRPGDRLRATLARGGLTCSVDETHGPASD